MLKMKGTFVFAVVFAVVVLAEWCSAEPETAEHYLLSVLRAPSYDKTAIPKPPKLDVVSYNAIVPSDPRDENRTATHDETDVAFTNHEEEDKKTGLLDQASPSRKTGNPLLVQAGIMVASIGDINEKAMDFWMTLYLRLEWRDHRLQFNITKYGDRPVVLTGSDIKLAWTPDIFLVNAKAGTKDQDQNTHMTFNIYPDGRVFYSKRINAQLSCQLDFHYYPLDKQTCYIKLESYGHRTDQLELDWKSDVPIETPHEALLLPHFYIEGIEEESCTTVLSTGAFPCLRVTIQLHRRYQYFVLQIYIPMVLVVILSWVSFWINIEAAPARVSIGLLTVLTITTQAFNANSSVPVVAYVKLMDVFVSGCYLFAVFSLLEYALVNVIARREKLKQERLKREKEEGSANDIAMQDMRPVDPETLQMIKNGDRAVDPDERYEKAKLRKNPKHRSHISVVSIISGANYRCLCHRYDRAISIGDKIDIFCRYAFPAAFIIFNAVFWVWVVVHN